MNNNRESEILHPETEKKLVDELIVELDTILFQIRRSGELLASIEDSDAKKLYQQQMDEMMFTYKLVCKNLKDLLDKYFIIERKNNLPRNLTYYRLYRNL